MALGSGVGDGTAAQLRGRFDAAEFLPLVRSFAHMQANGCLRIWKNGWQAELGLERGKIVSAVDYEEHGLAALEFIVLVLAQAEFGFWFGTSPAERNLEISPTELEAFVSQVSEICPVISAADLPTSSSISLVEPTPAAQLDRHTVVNRRDLFLLSNLDGQRTIAQIVSRHGPSRPLYAYLLTAVPLFVAGTLAVQNLGLSWQDLAIRRDRLLIQFLIALTGLPLAGLEYVFVRPAALLSNPSWSNFALSALILLISIGLLEEFLFRGLLLAAARLWLGSRGALFSSSIVFSVLQISGGSLIAVAFAFGMACVFAWLVTRTGSLVGVSLAHGITNIGASLLLPMVAVSLR